MPNVTIEVRRQCSPQEEQQIIAAVHAALMEGLKTPEWDKAKVPPRIGGYGEAFPRPRSIWGSRSMFRRGLTPIRNGRAANCTRVIGNIRCSRA